MPRIKIGWAAILLVSISGSFGSGIAAEGDVLWFRSYGGVYDDWPFALAPVSNGGWMLAGETTSFGAGSDDVWLIQLDELGDSLWSHTYGNSYAQGGRALISDGNGGWLVVVNQWNFGPPWYDAGLMRIGSYGDTLWTWQFSGPGMDELVAAVPVADGYLAAGHSESLGSQSMEQWLLKFGSSGDTLWTRTWSGQGNEQASHLLPTADGGSLGIGWTTSFSQMGQQITLWRNNAQGDSLWLRVYGRDEPQTVHDAVSVPGGGWLMACFAYNHFGFSVDDIWLLRVGEDGNEIWSKYYGSQYNENVKKIMPLSDGGWLLAGTAHPHGPLDADLYLLRVDSNGDSLWGRTYGTTGPEWFHDAVLTPDSCCLLGGSIYEAGSDYFDWWILKTSLDGDSLWSLSFGDSLWDDFIDIVTLTPEGDYLIVGQTGVNGTGYLDIGLLCLEGPSTGIIPSPPTQPTQFVLQKPCPNPFNSSTIVSYQMSVASNISLEVFDMSGRKLVELASGFHLPGEYGYVWDASGRAAGIYIVRLRGGEEGRFEKLVLLK